MPCSVAKACWIFSGDGILAFARRRTRRRNSATRALQGEQRCEKDRVWKMKVEGLERDFERVKCGAMLITILGKNEQP